MQDVKLDGGTEITGLGTGQKLKWSKAGTGIRIHFPSMGGPLAIRLSGVQ